MSPRILRVGIIGAGEVAQVIHLPALQLLNHLYAIHGICDISRDAVDFCARRYKIPVATTSAATLIAHPDIDVIFVLTSDESHETYTVAAIEAGKHVLVEKPVTLSLPSVDRILAAERRAAGASKVFVGYMRRYAPSFVHAFKREVEGIDKILYARSRDIIGPNSHFVGQSGTFPIKATDFPPGAGPQRAKLLDSLLQEAFPGLEVTPERRDFFRFLGSLGSHDISLMREALGFPDGVVGVTANEPFYSALFNYHNHDGSPFSVTYESGIDNVPRFDAHLAVYGMNKTVSIEYDTPYVKGLPIKVVVEEKNEFGECARREIVSSYEDAYTAELQELWSCVVEGKEPKTALSDAREDLRLFGMMFACWEQQRLRANT